MTDMIASESLSGNKGSSSTETEARNDEEHSAQGPGIGKVSRTELVWPGKYDELGNRRAVPRVSLPFQVIERVNESRATREASTARRKCAGG